MSNTINIQDEVDAIEAGRDAKAITPEHRAWMNAQIQRTLDKKARGEANYSPLEDVRKEFGF